MGRALVTGGAGFVGRHMVKRLLAEGYDVVCVDPLAPGLGGLPPAAWPEPVHAGAGFSFLEEDCRDIFTRSSERFDLICHLAAVVGGRMTIERDPLAVSVDLAIDAEMWRFAARTKARKVLYFSSSAVYPVALQRPGMDVLLREDMVGFGDAAADRQIGRPDMTYGWAKLTGEYLMRHYVELGGDAVAYRPFSGYGEDQDLSYPFPSICRRLLGCIGDAEVEVWGSGRQLRDFIHIDDCVDFVLASMDRLAPGSVLNLSSGIATSFIELAQMVAAEIGYAPRVTGRSEMPEGVFHRCGDRTLQEQLGLHPQVPLTEGIARVVEFQRRQLMAEG